MRLHLATSGGSNTEHHAGGIAFLGKAMKLYGALPGGVHGLGAMSVNQLLAAAETEPMKMYLAERDMQHHAWASEGSPRLRILISYHYYQDHDIGDLFAKWFHEPYPEVFLDSGAFSAATQNAPIHLPAYIAYIKRNRHWITTYVNLDVIGDPDATAANQRRMEEAGLTPLPVFHIGEPWSVLEDYLAHYAYIALGGMVPYANRPKVLMSWLVACYQRAHGKAVFHGFGATSWRVIKNLPWYSVDSSSWGQGFRYGRVPIFDPKRGTFVKLDLGDRPAWFKHAALVQSYGFDPADFADRTRNDRAKLCAISALSYLAAEAWLRTRHGEIQIPDRSNEPGVRLYMADANPARYAEAQAEGAKVYLADTSDGRNYADADSGVKLYAAGGKDDDKRDLSAANTGLRVYLAEHSLDRDGVGDTSRAQEEMDRDDT